MPLAISTAVVNDERDREEPKTDARRTLAYVCARARVVADEAVANTRQFQSKRPEERDADERVYREEGIEPRRREERHHEQRQEHRARDRSQPFVGACACARRAILHP